MIPPLQRIIQATLLFLPTTFIIPNSFLVLYCIFSIIIFSPQFKANDRLYFLFTIGVLVNFLLGIMIENKLPISLLVNNGLVGSIILVIGYLSARSLNDTTWRIILFYLFLEVICVYVQFALGIRYFFPQQEVINLTTEFQFTKDVEGTSLLYFIRPMGLSSTSTILAAKILLGLLLVFMLEIKRSRRIFLILLFVGAAIINFKRSGLVSLGLFFIIIFYIDIIKNGWMNRHSFFTLFCILIFGSYTSYIISQLTRESAFSLNQLSLDIFTTQLSGRISLWEETIYFIRNNFFFGNFSERLILSTGQYSHNSYLSLLSNHGFFLSILLITFFIRRIQEKRIILVFLFPIFVDAIFQEDLFWYISLIDQFVLYLLVTRRKSKHWENPLN
ncbi:MAG: hypothetical protein CBC47_06045 [Alphaproteobacteria bacterium TMED87]|nr:hypothetical protein [Rhodospirillaceae bacterium]OUV09121.1 MAG: hypothetical protein CBC47_06045 [Alphaproteobacteria bacterium TMED87]